MADDELPARVRLHGEVSGGAGELVVSDRLMASWLRSQDYGVSLESVDPVFTGTYDDGSLFFECAQEVLGDLYRTLINEPISLMLTDADGLVLNRLSGDTSLLRALDAVHLAPGFAYSEREAGTNGLGLALADRMPAVVRAEEHYVSSLCTYTCAAAPVLDPITGRVEGAVNLTTWSTSSSDLLLALAQSAASNTSSLMLARSRGHQSRPAPKGEVFRIDNARLEPGSGTLYDLSASWNACVEDARRALVAGRVVVAVGERGAGRATMLAQAQRAVGPRDRILSARAPAPQDVDAWLSLWAPELGKPHTAVIVCDVDALPRGAADHLRDLVVRARVGSLDDRPVQPLGGLPLALTAERFEDIPPSLAALVDTVVQVLPLRERSHDVVPLAHHFARKARGRDVELTPAADRALVAAPWPGNVSQLARVVRAAASTTDLIDIRHLPAEVLCGTQHRLSRIEAFERQELVRVLTRPGVTMLQAVEELGMSRATIYRKIAQYDVHISRS